MSEDVKDSPKRTHRATGAPRGGERPGAGRPEGTQNVLEYGEVRAVKAAGLRLPKNVTAEHAALADEALETIVSIMRGKVKVNFEELAEGFRPVPVELQSRMAIRVREEICGPLAQKIQHTGANDGALEIHIVHEREGDS